MSEQVGNIQFGKVVPEIKFDKKDLDNNYFLNEDKGNDTNERILERFAELEKENKMQALLIEELRKDIEILKR
jgi:hypothetical protein